MPLRSASAMFQIPSGTTQSIPDRTLTSVNVFSSTPVHNIGVVPGQSAVTFTNGTGSNPDRFTVQYTGYWYIQAAMRWSAMGSAGIWLALNMNINGSQWGYIGGYPAVYNNTNATIYTAQSTHFLQKGAIIDFDVYQISGVTETIGNGDSYASFVLLDRS